MEILVSVAVLLVAVAVLVVGLIWVRRRLTGGTDATPPGLTLSEMRALYEAGELSEQEYQSVRAAIIGSARVAAHGTLSLREQAEARRRAVDTQGDRAGTASEPSRACEDNADRQSDATSNAESNADPPTGPAAEPGSGPGTA